MRADDDVDAARAQTLDYRLDRFRRLKARQYFNPDRPLGKTVIEILSVLLRKQRGRHENRYLLAAVNRRERRAQSDLRLAETDIAANDTVHGLVGRKVLQDLVDGSGLVFGRVERKAVFERTVIVLGPAKAVSGTRRAARVDIQ